MNGKKYPYVLEGAAILGSALPAVKNLNDLTAYMADKIHKRQGTFIAIRSYSLTENYEPKTLSIKLPERRTGMVDIDEKELAKLKMQAEKSEKLEIDLKKMRDDRDREKRDALKKQFTAEIKSFKDFCNEKVKAKVLTPANRDMFFEQSDKKEFIDEKSIEEITTLKTFVENQTKVVDNENPKGTTNTNNDGDFTDVGDEVHFKVRKYMAEHPNVSYEDAHQLLLMQDKTLAKRYVDRPYELNAD